jgi:transposase
VRVQRRKLARCYRNGDLTAVWIPDGAHEALRDLLRAREVAKQDQHRARQRLGKFLLRHGAQATADTKKQWTAKYMTWLNTHVRFEQPALQAMLLDYVHEVHHAGERIARLEKAIDEAIMTAPEQSRSVVAAR